jgi:hypothetical protein
MFAIGLNSTAATPASCNDETGRRDDRDAMISLVRILGSDDSLAWRDADRYSEAIASHSPYRWYADYAMAMIRTRQARYAQAWKLTESLTSQVSSKSPSLQIGHCALGLWLAVEAHAPQWAEPRLKKLVAFAIDKNVPNDERMVACEFVGNMIGMLQANSSPCISAQILKESVMALESNEPKWLVDPFQKGLSNAQEWGQNLTERLAWMQSSSEAEIQKLISSSAKKRNDAESELKAARDAKEECFQEKKSIEMSRRMLASKVSSLKREWETPTPGKPKIPSKDHSRSIYRTECSTDPTTGKQTCRRVLDPWATRFERDRTERNFQVELNVYDRDLQTWEFKDATRRDKLRAQMVQAENELGMAQKRLKALEQSLKDLTSEFKAKLSEAKEMERSLQTCKIALEYIKSDQSKPKPIVRPSNFELLRFDVEVSRLAKNYRSSPS